MLPPIYRRFGLLSLRCHHMILLHVSCAREVSECLSPGSNNLAGASISPTNGIELSIRRISDNRSPI